MNLRSGLLASTILLSLAALVPNQAYASLSNAGATLQVFYYNGVLADPEGELPVGASTDDPVSLVPVPVNYQLGAADFSTISVSGTKIAITNQASGFPFCVADNPGNTCTDAIDGFDFKFTGENILSVTVDPASSADFLPVSGTFQGNTHLGLQLISPNEVRVDVTGDPPALGDELILDVDTPASSPEPSTLSLCGGAIGLFLVFRRTSRGSKPARPQPAREVDGAV